MTFQMLLNLVIAMTWMLLHDTWNALTFTTGYLIGLVFIFGLRRFFPSRFYVGHIWSILKLTYLFIIELIKSTIVVAKQVTRPRLNIEPGIFRVETVLSSDWEILLLSCLITLTPGSVVMEVAPEDRTMYIHAMDAEEFKSSIMESKRIFEKAILEVTN